MHKLALAAFFVAQSSLCGVLIHAVLSTSNGQLPQDLVLCGIIGLLPFLFTHMVK